MMLPPRTSGIWRKDNEKMEIWKNKDSLRPITVFKFIYGFIAFCHHVALMLLLIMEVRSWFIIQFMNSGIRMK